MTVQALAEGDDSDWPIVIDGDEFQPIPEEWLGWGFDDDDAGPRLFAVSASVTGRDVVTIRYLHPTEPRVVRAAMNGADDPHSDGVVPAMLVKHGRWPRSICPGDSPPADVARRAEIRHLRELWGSRVPEIPRQARDAVLADGGRAVSHLTDMRQDHLSARFHRGERTDA